MPLSLSADLERQITERVESGEYESAEAVLRDALRALTAAEQEHANRLEALRVKIQDGIDDLDNGRHSPLEDVVARLRERRNVAPRHERGTCCEASRAGFGRSLGLPGQRDGESGHWV